MVFITFRRSQREPPSDKKHLRAGRILGFHIKRLSGEFDKSNRGAALLAKVNEHRETVDQLILKLPLKDVLKTAYEAKFASWFQKLKGARVSFLESEMEYLLRFQQFVAAKKVAGIPVYKSVFRDMGISIEGAVRDLKFVKRARTVAELFPKG